ncbi:hypothetical protein HK102_002114 [Quaeritorhiza haematococci]|nr:hypothetical protein HK102_002114 [Quaeritorhiza haematococci]
MTTPRSSRKKKNKSRGSPKLKDKDRDDHGRPSTSNSPRSSNRRKSVVIAKLFRHRLAITCYGRLQHVKNTLRNK